MPTLIAIAFRLLQKPDPLKQFDAETATVGRRYAVETNQVSRDGERQANNLAWIAQVVRKQRS
jgi:hypothetical protein